MTYIPDPLERAEARAERYMAPNGMVICCVCKQETDPNECECTGPPPIGLPICRDCLEIECREDERRP